MFDTLGQPLVAAYFLIAGVFGYFLYEFITSFGRGFAFLNKEETEKRAETQTIKRKTKISVKIIMFITDFISVSVCGFLIFLTAYLKNDGRILFYEIMCFFVSYFLCMAIFQKGIRKVFDKVFEYLYRTKNKLKENLHNYFVTAHNNFKRRKYERQERKRIAYEQRVDKRKNRSQTNANGERNKRQR